MEPDTNSKPAKQLKVTSLTQTPEVKVVTAEDTGMDNYPFSVEVARANLEQYLATMAADGYKYHGTISRPVGIEDRSFYVFYR